MTPIISVSIVLFRTPIAQLRRCISSLNYYNKSIRLFLIDNSPTDSLRSEISQIYPYKYVHLPHNPGFGTAHNLAIRAAQLIGSHYHLVINADVSFTTDIISPMMDYMEKNLQIGLLMPKVTYPDGRIQRLCKLVPTPLDFLVRRLAPSGIRASYNERFEMHNSGYDRVMFVPYLSGCFMLLRQSALKEVGLFDERYFMYPEDIDLTRRIAEKYETIFFPSVAIVHEHGAASRKSIRFMLIHAVNTIKYFNKWGWFWDPKRSLLNKKALGQFHTRLP